MGALFGVFVADPIQGGPMILTAKLLLSVIYYLESVE